jgi:hypothetical protein
VSVKVPGEFVRRACLCVLAAVAMLSGCSSSHHSAVRPSARTLPIHTPTSASIPSGQGRLIGHLIDISGATMPYAQPISGAITVTGRGRSWHLAASAADGFAVNVPPGVYRVTGTDSKRAAGSLDWCAIEVNHGQVVRADPVVVRAGSPTAVRVVCREL